MPTPQFSSIGEGDTELNSEDRSLSQKNHVAVVIPVRNRSDLLEKCLASLKGQNLPEGPIEIIVCDDGSNDDPRMVVEKFLGCLPQIRLVRQEAKGPAAARNLGFRSSSAAMFICLDSDIVCAPDCIKLLVKALEVNPDWVAAEATVLPLHGKYSILCDAPENRGGSFLSAASAYRADALKVAGGFDEEFPRPACEDADLAARLLQIGQYGYMPEAIAYHPLRPVTLRTHWRWRRHWKYEMILAKRYGFLSFPGHPSGPYPRLRVALAAIVTLPAGRFLQGVKEMLQNPRDGILACLYALFDVFCGTWALPNILFGPVPPRRNYLSNRKPDTGRV